MHRTFSCDIAVPNQDTSPLLTIRDWLRYAISRFTAADLFFGHGSNNAFDEAAYLILHSLHLPLDRLEPFLDARLLPEEASGIAQILDRRINERLPAPYLTHEAWLQGYRFYVDERVIVPRSFLAPMILEQFQPWLIEPVSVFRALNLYTGSGCLAVLLAEAFPEAEIDAVDPSPDALEVARRNVEDYGLEDQITLYQGDLFAPLSGMTYDLIISNPPYVNAASVAALPYEYRHEPVLALGSGSDGLDATRNILRNAAQHLNPGGMLVMEIGHNRAELEAAYPNLEMMWPETEDSSEGSRDTVFLLVREQLLIAGGEKLSLRLMGKRASILQNYPSIRQDQAARLNHPGHQATVAERANVGGHRLPSDRQQHRPGRAAVTEPPCGARGLVVGGDPRPGRRVRVLRPAGTGNAQEGDAEAPTGKRGV